MAYCAGQTGSFYAPPMRTVGGRMVQTSCQPGRLRRAKPSVRISFDPRHHMEDVHSPHKDTVLALSLEHL